MITKDQVCPIHGCIVPSRMGKNDTEYWLCTFGKHHFLDDPNKFMGDLKEPFDIYRDENGEDREGYHEGHEIGGCWECKDGL